jgi:amidase
MSQFIRKENRTVSFCADHSPVLDVSPGAVVTFETGDEGYQRLSHGERIENIGIETLNAVTGPVYVKGAQEGDVLCVELQGIEMQRVWSVWLPGFGLLGNKTDRMQVKQIHLEDDRARISEQVTVALEPMVGCIGVAPASGEGSTVAPCYPWGGNMDLREFSPGATLFLPVQVGGALLSMGDFHAGMGAGEPTCVSLEGCGEATVRIDLEKDKELEYPRLRVGEQTICVGMGVSVKEASAVALDQAHEVLVGEFDMEPFDAYAYASARVGLRFGGPASPTILAVVPDPY